MNSPPLEMLRYLTWSDCVDILAVSCLIYYGLSLLSGTRAANLLKGIGLVFLVKVLSNRFGLYSLEWLINIFMTLGVAALVIIFQPELRRALEHLGRGGILPIRLPQDQVANMVVELESALLRLAATRTGALVILEQRTGLRDYCETGVLLNAQISERLLLTIFHHLTPLHDGAVIISRYRIEAASCFLPLSQSTELALELGTRHRAGLGITEISDAVALVVSEETGHISWAEGGKMTRGLGQKDLHLRLCKLFGVLDPEYKPVGAVDAEAPQKVG
ncbi:MAG: TIGR00159 family protein [Candidatus Riflebacteria bacterium]|nr:TIGR00159 family protein [Candidatus Riflebacteria bacterium]